MNACSKLQQPRWRQWRNCFVGVVVVILTAVCIFLNGYASMSTAHARVVEIQTRIPRRIHMTWLNYDVPRAAAATVKSWATMNPTYEFWFWNDDDIRALVVDRYPEQLAMFDNYPTGIFRADAMRYYVLDTFGGFYADLDVECLQPMDFWASERQCILAEEPYEHAYLLHHLQHSTITNAFIACRARHPLFSRIIDELPNYASTDLLHATGPYFIDDVYRKYASEGDNETDGDKRGDVFVATPEVFMPTVDPIRVGEFIEQCKQMLPEMSEFNRTHPTPKNAVCLDMEHRGFSNLPRRESYADHKWLHYWTLGDYRKWRQWLAVSITKLWPNVRTYRNKFACDN